MTPRLLAEPDAGAASAAPAAGVSTIQVVRDAEAFDALAADWDDLVDRCSAATPFQSHAWLSSWWRGYGRPGRLRVVTVRQDGRLVAAAPLMLRRLPTARYVGIGAGLSDFLDVLLDDSAAEQLAPVLARALVKGLRLNRPWAVLDLRELRAGGAAHRLAGHWPGAARLLPDSLCQYLPGVPMDEVLGRLPGRTAQRNRAKLRKLEAAGVESRELPAEEVPRAVGELLALHERQWRGRGVTPEHLRPRFSAHLTRAVTGMVAADRAVVRQYRLDGELIACDLTLQSPDLSALYVYGVHPEIRDRLDVAGMLFRECLAHANRTGRGEVSLLRGDEPYKQRWRPEQARSERLLLGAAPGVAVLAGAVRLRAAGVAALRERMPWLVDARRRLRELLQPGVSAER
ncbi:GNAT family N-acetyltransferase [Streptacidiphilus cavernicola]|uniref:GNAT family N-acetyltransferase n=1 Tax=Streptacidiphilus cavernicola TaxID=3342716 RepID=A0ABV6W152_9ACTN